MNDCSMQSFAHIGCAGKESLGRLAHQLLTYQLLHFWQFLLQQNSLATLLAEYWHETHCCEPVFRKRNAQCNVPAYSN